MADEDFEPLHLRFSGGPSPSLLWIGAGVGLVIIVAVALIHMMYSWSEANEAKAEQAKFVLAGGELLTIRANIGYLYVTGNPFDEPFHTDITCQVESLNVFPKEMIQNANCVYNDKSTYPVTPWGSHVVIYASLLGDDGTANTESFQIDYALYPLDPNPCAPLLRRVLASKEYAGLKSIWIGVGPISVVDGPPDDQVLDSCHDAGFDFFL